MAMWTTTECPICIQYPTDPHEITGCKHVFCKKCINSMRPTEGKLLCPMCRRDFLIKDLKPVKLPEDESSKVESEEEVEEEEGDFDMRYCLKLTCKPNSGCKKLHFDDLCPSLPQKEGPKVIEDLPPEKEEEDFKLPEDARYCWDIECPGGEKATCGKIHESDIFNIAVNS